MRRQLAGSTVASAALAGLVLAGALAPSATAAPPEMPGKDLSKHVTGERVFKHLEAFQAIADAHGGNRAMGTSGYEASAEYVESVLRKSGYTPERQYFTFEQDVVDALALTAAGIEVPGPLYPAEFSPQTPQGGVTGPIVQPSDAMKHGCTAADWAGVDATGGVALVSRGSCAFSVKVLTASAAGAEAVIIYNNVSGPLNPTLGAEDPAYVPAVGISLEAGQAILAALADGGDPVATYDYQSHVEEFESFNVLASTRTGDPDNVVMLGAHLDSVEDGPGINDNGTGSAAILETAVQLARSGPLNNQVRFAWWGAEELGLIGSTHYVNDLVANDPEELDRIATYLNFDMVGSPNYTIGVYDANESTYDAPVPVPAGSVETEAVFTDYFDSIGQPWVDSEFSGRSDYQAFINNGIPASGLFTGADGIKTEEEAAIFGGTAGIRLDPNYHTPADDITNVDKTALDIMSRAIGHAAQKLAWSTEAINGVVPGGPGNS
ncbi:M20/M25/M40 family metallo-hydrolase [Isoptericola variabilis]|uniref:Aminopeptidase Y n=1 Tax=Isoptericola variabilis (strain 225) TaxID=743718 RepID=F6FW74_ISOV2|nr:M20/M25/M40 family metallo-hydrolase [Isoptericola variabilis]AEG45618.1 Aminopeptidase Y [Isoptericola variabilis 225]TWH25773.1 PA domain-containing protein [Isoptericola variabilis J7]